MSKSYEIGFEHGNSGNGRRQSAKKRPVGRPVEVDGKRVQVYLDEDSLKTAFRLGGGNVSRGIRIALAATQHKS